MMLQKGCNWVAGPAKNLLANDRDPACLLIDAEYFGQPKQFFNFVTAIAAVVAWPKRVPRFAFATLGWADDDDLAEWAAMGWGVIVAYPRPASLLSLHAVRRISRAGTLILFPDINSHHSNGS
jgi:hypothetical protein